MQAAPGAAAPAAGPAARAAVPVEPPTPVEPPATVDLRGDDLRSDGLADPVRHDDDPPVPAGPVTAGEPGRP